MDKLATYALVAAIGEITRPTKEDRVREGDRWVALRTLQNPPTTIREVAPPPPPQEPQQPAYRKPLYYSAIQQRHLNARRMIGE